MEQILKNKQTFKKILFTLLILLIPVGILSFWAPPLIVFYILMAVIILIIYHNVKIVKPYKENVIPEILKKHKPTITYIPKITKEEIKPIIEIIRNNKLIPAASTFSFTDCLIDDYKGKKIVSYDLHATHTQSNGKTTTTITDFRGRFYDVEYPGLDCDFIIKEEYIKRIPNGYEFLELEHIESNNAFNIYVTDKLESFKIFTPSVIKNYYELAGTDMDKTIIHYYNNHLYVYLYNNSNIFESCDEDFEKTIINEYQKQYDNLVEYIKIFTYYNK